MMFHAEPSSDALCLRGPGARPGLDQADAVGCHRGQRVLDGRLSPLPLAVATPDIPGHEPHARFDNRSVWRVRIEGHVGSLPRGPGSVHRYTGTRLPRARHFRCPRGPTGPAWARELLQFLPFLTSKEPSVSSAQRRALIAGGVRMQDERTLGRRQVRGLVVGQRAPDEGGRDLGDLISVHEPQSVLGLDRDAVEEIEFGYLQYVFNRPELRIGGTQDGRTNG